MMRSLQITILCLALAAGTSCSSGGGGSVEGGIGGSGITRGVLTGLNSATVAGTKFDTDEATLERDGVEVPLGDFNLGEVVTIRGTRQGDAGDAEDLVYDGNEVTGPIDSLLELSLNVVELTILGVTVEVQRGSTLFGPSPFGFDDLAEGQLIGVSGLADGSGRVTATFVSLDDASPGAMPDVQRKGFVANPDSGAGTFEIGDLTVEYDPMGIDTELVPPMAVIAEGDLVDVSGVLVDPTTIDATLGGARVEVEVSMLEGNEADIQLEGIVSDYVNIFDFRVAGQQVEADDFDIEFEPEERFDCRIDPFTCSFLADGLRVVVEGRLVFGVVVADAVRLRSADSRVSAAIADAATDVVDNMDGTGTITLLEDPTRGAVRIQVDTGTRLDGFASLGALATGDFIEVRGVLVGASAASEKELLATEIELEDDSEDVELFGRVLEFDDTAQFFNLLGLRLPTACSNPPTTCETLFVGFPENPLLDPQEEFYDFLASNPNTELLAVDETDVAGDMDATSFDLADEVVRESEVRVAAEIADDGDVDDVLGTILLLGAIQIEVSGATELEEFDELSELGAGDFIEVEGMLVDDMVVATKLKLEEESKDVEVRGPVEDFGPGNTVTILGLAIPVDSNTEFEDMELDDMTEVEDPGDFLVFLGENPGILLEVKDKTEAPDDDATTLDVADEVEVEEDEDD